MLKTAGVGVLAVALSACVSTGPNGQSSVGISAETATVALTSALATAILMQGEQRNSEQVVIERSSQSSQSSSQQTIWGTSDPFGSVKHDSRRTFSIRTGGGRCLDISRQVVDGAPLQVWDCNDRVNQRFAWRGDELRIDGKCLDIAELDSRDGARVIAYRCHGGINQRWTMVDGQIRSRMNGKCLDVRGADYNKGTPVIMWRCNGQANQRFRLS